MHDTLRPRLELFANEAIDRIIDQAIEVLNDVGIRVEDSEARALLQEGGAQVRGERCFVSKDMVEKALASAPNRILLYDRDGTQAMDLGGERVHFNPGSTAIQILDRSTDRHRDPTLNAYAHVAVDQAWRAIKELG